MVGILISWSLSIQNTQSLLKGYSYLTLPTLQNAYSDLHMALDFKPESWNGVILITGQTDDMTGDYLALILNDGYVELR